MAERFAARLPAHWSPVIAPLTRIEPLPPAGDLPPAQAVMFTSQNGVESWVAGGLPLSYPAFCVGTRTAQAARKAGFAAHDAAGDLTALVRLIGETLDPEDGAILHARGRHVAGDPQGELAASGFDLVALPVYDAVEQGLSDDVASGLRAERYGGIAIFSPRAATILAREALDQGWPLEKVQVFSISAKAAAPLSALDLRAVCVSETADEPGIIAMLRCNGFD